MSNALVAIGAATALSRHPNAPRIHDPETMILAGEAIRPFCTSAPSDELPKAVQNPPLTVTELRAVGSGGVRVFIAPDGRQYVAVGTRVDVGRWRITPAGLYCCTWDVTDGGRERCYHVDRDGEINRKVAKTLALEIPHVLLQQADQVID